MRLFESESRVDLTPSLVGFHESGMAKHLWKAIRILDSELAKTAETMNPESLVDASVKTEDLIEKCLSEARSATFAFRRKQINEYTSLALRMASIASLSLAFYKAGLSLPASLLSGMTATNFLANNRPTESRVRGIENRITDWIQSNKFRSLSTHLWWIEKWKKTGH